MRRGAASCLGAQAPRASCLVLLGVCLRGMGGGRAVDGYWWRRRCHHRRRLGPSCRAAAPALRAPFQLRRSHLNASGSIWIRNGSSPPGSPARTTDSARGRYGCMSCGPASEARLWRRGVARHRQAVSRFGNPAHTMVIMGRCARVASPCVALGWLTGSARICRQHRRDITCAGLTRGSWRVSSGQDRQRA
jgi:hypothetical protein